jgi:hypothetical protein
LKSIGANLSLTNNREMINYLNYLDSTSKILKYVNFNNNSNTVCNQQYYLCDYSNTTNYAPYDALVKYLRANSGMLQQENVASLSLFNEQSQLFLNLTKFGLSEGNLYNQSEALMLANENISNISTSSYYFKEIKIDHKTYLDVIC